jgi:hypothetical protein
MAAIRFRERPVRRWWYVGMTVAAATVLGVLYVAGAGASLPGSTFGGGDGNLACNDATISGGGALDWNCLGDNTTPKLNIGTEQFSGQQDNAFGQGTKEDDSNVTLVQGSIPPQKSDLTRFYEASEAIPGYTDGSHVLIYLAWERSNVLGSANMDFEINKVGTACLGSTSGFPVKCTINRSVGDILVTYDFTNGGSTPTIGLRTWNGSSWQPDSNIVAESAVNSGSVSDTHANMLLAANTFGEAAIDLTASGLVPAGSCGFSQATTFLKSRSSASFTSEIKDFVAPISTPINPCEVRITTSLSANPVEVGSTVHDSAALTGQTTDAGGTVTYTVYTDSGCTSVYAAAGTKTVTNGIVPDSDPITFNSTGTFYWQAVYSGDGKNQSATSICTSEALVVNPVRPLISTAQHLIPNDDATISAATSGAGGTITFSLFSPSDATCSGTPALTQTVNVSGNGTYSTTNTTFVVSAEGTWRWQVVYTGDSNNAGASSACGVEQFTIANH